jgi:hypothetical protein
MAINYQKSAELNNCSIPNLKVWFTNYPKSHKQIIAICNICKKERKIIFSGYRKICKKCVMNTPEMKKSNSDRVTKHHSNPEYRKEQSNKLIQYYINNPEKRKEISKIRKNSKAVKIVNEKRFEKQRGGEDLVRHHYIYDHNDLSKYTTLMTRSKHTQLHQSFRKCGIFIPHINRN